MVSEKQEGGSFLQFCQAIIVDHIMFAKMDIVFSQFACFSQNKFNNLTCSGIVPSILKCMPWEMHVIQSKIKSCLIGSCNRLYCAQSHNHGGLFIVSVGGGGGSHATSPPPPGPPLTIVNPLCLHMCYMYIPSMYVPMYTKYWQCQLQHKLWPMGPGGESFTILWRQMNALHEGQGSLNYSFCVMVHTGGGKKKNPN